MEMILMKKIILIILSLLVMPSAFGLVAGDTWKYYFDDCYNKLNAEIIGEDTIVEGEYKLLSSNCTAVNYTYYECNCSGDFWFNLSFSLLARNNYTIKFNHNYLTAEIKETKKSGGSSGGGGGSFTLTLSKDKPITKMLIKNRISKIKVNGEYHSFKVLEITKDIVRVEIRSKPIIVELELNKTKSVDLDRDGKDDLILTLIKFNQRTGISYIKFENILEENINQTFVKKNETLEEIPEKQEEEENPVEEKEEELSKEEEKVKDLKVMLISIGFIVLIALCVLFIVYRKRKEDEV
jgi:hypothetical protein